MIYGFGTLFAYKTKLNKYCRILNIKGEYEMKKLTVLLVTLAVVAMTSFAWAVPLATYTHNYGSGVGQFDPEGNDVLSNGFVTVSDQSSVRFSDSFNFNSVSYSSINHFDLTLTFSNTNGAFLNPELWFARPGGTPDQYTSFKLNNAGNGTYTQSFVVDYRLVPEFNQMVNSKNFFFWFAEDTWFADNFRLYSASLDIDGTPVPEPGTIMLLGAGLLGLAVFGKRRMNK